MATEASGGGLVHGKVYTSEERMKPTFYGAYIYMYMKRKLTLCMSACSHVVHACFLTGFNDEWLVM